MCVCLSVGWAAGVGVGGLISASAEPTMKQGNFPPPTSCKRLHHFVLLFFSVCVAACFSFALSSDTTDLFRMTPPPSPGKLAWPLQGKVSWYRVALASQLINPQSCTLSGNGRWEGWVLRNSVRGGWGVGEEKVRGRWGRGVGDRKVGWGWGWGCTAMTNK